MSKLMKRVMLLSALWLLASTASAFELEGLWKNTESPLWIKITNTDGDLIGKIVRNDKRAETAGRVMLKNVSPKADEVGTYTGQVFVVRAGEFKRVSISSIDSNTMEFKVKVGFISGRVNWSRVGEMPEAIKAGAENKAE